MGYDFHADVEILVTDQVANDMKSDIGTLRVLLDEVGRSLPEDIDAHNLMYLLDEVWGPWGGLFYATTCSEYEDEEGTRQVEHRKYYGELEVRWGRRIPVLLSWMASHGAGMYIWCEGEGSDVWSYKAKLGGSTMVTTENEID